MRTWTAYYGDTVNDFALGLAVAPNGAEIVVTGGEDPKTDVMGDCGHFNPNWATVMYTATSAPQGPP